ncbi:MAG: cupredoxin domain-containing protein, partial [Myxococcales bacterium]
GAAHRLPAEVPGKKSVIGMITDSTCLLRGEKPAPEHADCAVRCIQNGAPIAIVEEKTGEVFVATAAQGRSVTELLIPFVGQRTEIYGKVFKQGGTQFLVVEDVMPEHQHTPKEGGVVAMMGDLHLELVAAPDGEVRLYLSDDFRKPLPASGRRGTVEVRVDDGPVASKPLLPEPNGAFLAASFPPFGSKAVEVTVRMPLPEDPNYFITFVVEPAGAAPAPKQEAEKPSTEAVITVQGGYKPERVVVKKGVKTKLIFNRMDTGFCSSEVKIPKLGVHEALAELQATVIEITPTEAGEIPYTCGMGMMRGTIVVVP